MYLSRITVIVLSILGAVQASAQLNDTNEFGSIWHSQTYVNGRYSSYLSKVDSPFVYVYGYDPSGDFQITKASMNTGDIIWDYADELSSSSSESLKYVIHNEENSLIFCLRGEESVFMEVAVLDNAGELQRKLSMSPVEDEKVIYTLTWTATSGRLGLMTFDYNNEDNLVVHRQDIKEDLEITQVNSMSMNIDEEDYDFMSSYPFGEFGIIALAKSLDEEENHLLIQSKDDNGVFESREVQLPFVYVSDMYGVYSWLDQVVTIVGVYSMEDDDHAGGTFRLTIDLKTNSISDVVKFPFSNLTKSAYLDDSEIADNEEIDDEFFIVDLSYETGGVVGLTLTAREFDKHLSTSIHLITQVSNESEVTHEIYIPRRTDYEDQTKVWGGFAHGEYRLLFSDSDDHIDFWKGTTDHINFFRLMEGVVSMISHHKDGRITYTPVAKVLDSGGAVVGKRSFELSEDENRIYMLKISGPYDSWDFQLGSFSTTVAREDEAR
ncbi:MAG: hypothetical protein HWE14_02085 [Flavobacteriia bacterium]|nr:hypothetical protein [Flavobacteriia bacterium]